MRLKPSWRPAYPLIGRSALAEGVMSTLAAPTCKVPLFVRGVSRSDTPIRSIVLGQIFMIIVLGPRIDSLGTAETRTRRLEPIFLSHESLPDGLLAFGITSGLSISPPRYKSQSAARTRQKVADASSVR